MHLKAHNATKVFLSFFHFSLANSMTYWAQIFTVMLFYACWNTPSENTGLWQLPKVSSALISTNPLMDFRYTLIHQQWRRFAVNTKQCDIKWPDSNQNVTRHKTKCPTTCFRKLNSELYNFWKFSRVVFTLEWLKCKKGMCLVWICLLPFSHFMCRHSSILSVHFWPAFKTGETQNFPALFNCLDYWNAIKKCAEFKLFFNFAISCAEVHHYLI